MEILLFIFTFLHAIKTKDVGVEVCIPSFKFVDRLEGKRELNAVKVELFFPLLVLIKKISMISNNVLVI